ncbi:MAG: PQQ-dependent sugar dehydrogenase [Chthoniobacterales bacterium]|nr:PQQ-dependent sugar dehydrogenase [Chthoniobacterales bacterium]
MKSGIPVLCSLLVFCHASPGETVTSEAHRFRVEPVAENLDHPWAVEKLPDGRFLVTERQGNLLLIDRAGAPPQNIAGVPPVFARGQGGLLDVELHPDYAENGWIYLTFSKPTGKGALTSVVRAKLDGGKLADLETIFEPPADQATEAVVHFGSRIAFDGRGNFFFSIGDRGGPTNPRNLAQSLSSVTGKIHRLRDDGAVPPDNPFVATPGAMPSIWAYGVRNPQGLVYDTASARLWETEHGPRGGDELNIIRKGANYGWPVATFGINYSGTTITDKTSLPGMEDPVAQWTPVIAASGLALYRGDKFPRWQGNLFAGGLAGQRLVRIELSGAIVAAQEILLKDTGRIRDVRVFDDGFLYVVYDEPGKVVRLVPAE